MITTQFRLTCSARFHIHRAPPPRLTGHSLGAFAVQGLKLDVFGDANY